MAGRKKDARAGDETEAGLRVATTVAEDVVLPLRRVRRRLPHDPRRPRRHIYIPGETPLDRACGGGGGGGGAAAQLGGSAPEERKEDGRRRRWARRGRSGSAARLARQWRILVRVCFRGRMTVGSTSNVRGLLALSCSNRFGPFAALLTCLSVSLILVNSKSFVSVNNVK